MRTWFRVRAVLLARGDTPRWSDDRCVTWMAPAGAPEVRVPIEYRTCHSMQMRDTASEERTVSCVDAAARGVLLATLGDAVSAADVRLVELKDTVCLCACLGRNGSRRCIYQ
jgi:hypothetical protein